MEGLSYGCGDAVIGLNPVDGTGGSVERILKSFDEFKNRWEVAYTDVCAGAYNNADGSRGKRKAPADLIFQSIAGSQKGNEAFGLTAKMLQDANDLMLERGTGTGRMSFIWKPGRARSCHRIPTMAGIR